MRSVLCGGCLLLLCSTVLGAEEDPGYLELRGAWLAGVSGQQGQLVQELRPTFSTPLGERVKLVATVGLALSEGRDGARELRRVLEAEGLEPLLEAAGCTWEASGSEPFRVSRASDYLEVARLHLDYYSGPVDVRVGRQAVHWGSAQFFNPTDPFPEVLLAEPWRPRRGINAARAQVALGALSGIDLVAAVDDALHEGRAAARLRANRWGVDAALSVGWRGGEAWLVGLDLRGTLGLGYWLEAALRPTDGVVHEELAVGVDYSFEVLDRLVVMAQYYRNGAGSSAAAPAQRLGRLGEAGLTCAGSPFGASRDPYAPFTTGRDYLLTSVAAVFSPDLSATLPLLLNLQDGSAVVIPTATWAATDWLDLSLSAQLPFGAWGHGGELHPGSGDLVFTPPPGSGVPPADLSGLVPAATITLWTRASF